jgi:5-methylcytosine-specific restriction endonuclease McrA
MPPKGWKHSAESRARMSASRLGKPKSAAHRAKLSEALVGNTRNLGNTLTPEHRANISAANKGKPKSPEHRAQISAARRADDLTYKAAHTRFLREWPKQGRCKECQRVGKTEWCWLHQRDQPGGWSLNRADYREMCPTCHKAFDRSIGQNASRALDGVGGP